FPAFFMFPPNCADTFPWAPVVPTDLSPPLPHLPPSRLLAQLTPSGPAMRTSFLVVVITCLLTQAPRAAGEELPLGDAELFPAAASEASPAVIEDFVPATSRYGHWSVGGEYLIWFLREGRVPPLLTTSGFSSGGRLGEPDTQVLYGNDRLQT